ncbi:MAG TPA: sensor histidine kinase [Actinocrinis sp.]|nr:sensor histidine kinase [Actinocrinis sp.]
MDAARLAELIEAERARVVDSYREALDYAGSPIVRDPVAWQQAAANAQQVLTDIIDSLRQGSTQLGENYRLLSWDIGTTRAAGGVHPGESAYASSVFFQTVMVAAVGLLASADGGLELLGRVAFALERSIRERGRAALAGYTSFLLNKVHEAQIGERRRIARELHDRVGHSLSVAHQQLELYDAYRQDNRRRAAAKIDAAQHAVQEAMGSLRAITSDLYAMETLKSLEKALAGYLERADSDGVEVHLQVNGDENWARPQVLDECFLILREAARNTLRHARATLLVVNVDITPHEIRGSVQDDGAGFDPNAPAAGAGVGLSAIRERIRLLGGTVRIASTIGKGTLIAFSVPL